MEPVAVSVSAADKTAGGAPEASTADMLKPATASAASTHTGATTATGTATGATTSANGTTAGTDPESIRAAGAAHASTSGNVSHISSAHSRDTEALENANAHSSDADTAEVTTLVTGGTAVNGVAASAANDTATGIDTVSTAP